MKNYSTDQRLFCTFEMCYIYLSNFMHVGEMGSPCKLLEGENFVGGAIEPVCYTDVLCKKSPFKDNT